VTTAFETRTIEQAIETLIDYRGKTPPKTTHGVPLITAKVIKGGFIQQENPEFIAIDFYDAWMRRGLPKQWDVLITTEAPLGEVAQIRKAERIALAQRVILLRGNPKVVDQGYLYQAMKSDFVQGELKARASGTTVLGIKQSELWKVKIPWHTLPTQRKIARVLSAYDDLIENNSRRIAILEEMAQAIYREWFVNFRFPGHENVKLIDSPLGKIPEGWKVNELTDLGFLGRGKSRHRPRNEPSLYGGPYPFFQTGDIKGASTYLWNYSQTYSELGLDQSKLWDIGTLCITIAANIAETAILARKGCFPDSVVGFVADPQKSDALYVKMFIDSIKQNMQNVSRGTTQDNLSVEKLLTFKIPTPPFSQIKAFHQEVSPLLQHTLVLFKKNELLRQTRDLLLPKLISGQLDVEDLDIEIGEQPEEATT
jgi:type I restriction enzyme S subunit